MSDYVFVNKSKSNLILNDLMHVVGKRRYNVVVPAGSRVDFLVDFKFADDLASAKKLLDRSSALKWAINMSYLVREADMIEDDDVAVVAVPIMEEVSVVDEFVEEEILGVDVADVDDVLSAGGIVEYVIDNTDVMESGDFDCKPVEDYTKKELIEKLNGLIDGIGVSMSKKVIVEKAVTAGITKI